MAGKYWHVVKGRIYLTKSINYGLDSTSTLCLMPYHNIYWMTWLGKMKLVRRQKFQCNNLRYITLFYLFSINALI